MMKCVIVEDEYKARELLKSHIEKIRDLELLAEFNNAEGYLEYTRDQKIDIVFLDINLPGINGVEAGKYPELKHQLIIFTTAHSEHAVESYELNAVDYLLKPTTFNRFSTAVDKARDLIDKRDQKKDFFIKSGKEIIHLQWNEIRYIEGQKEYCSLVSDKKKVLIYKRMKELEQVTPSNFIRIHNSYIVNYDYLEKVEHNHVMINSKLIPVGPTYRKDFFDLMRDSLI